MNLIPRLATLVSSGLLAAVLGGCAAAPAKSEAHDHATMGGMDMQSHCEKHKKMMNGKSTAEQQAMMQEHMKSMAPEMRQRMQAMHEQCR